MVCVQCCGQRCACFQAVFDRVVFVFYFVLQLAAIRHSQAEQFHAEHGTGQRLVSVSSMIKLGTLYHRSAGTVHMWLSEARGGVLQLQVRFEENL